MARIGFLGLGAMGLPMAKRLCSAGHQLVVTVHSNPAPASALQKRGAAIVPDVPQVVAGADFVISILPEDKDVNAVFLSPQVMDSLMPGTVIIEMSTLRPATVRELAQTYAGRQVHVLDAPVSGGIPGAENGTLTIMCGGDPAILERARAVLECMGNKIHLVGDIGAGKGLKAVNNLMGAANTVIAAEALMLVKKLGLDVKTAYEVIKTSSGQSYNFDARFLRMAAGDLDEGFKVRLMLKDMRIALAESEGSSMPMSALAYQLYQMTPEEDRDMDYGSVVRIFRKKSGNDF